MFRSIGFIFLIILVFALALAGYRKFVPSSVVRTPPLTTMAGVTSGPLSSTVALSTTAHLPIFKHIFIIIMENKERSSIVDNPEASYVNQLAAQYARANQFYATRKPSLPNYMALTGGDTFNISNDCMDCFVASDSIVTAIEASGRSWKAYMEGMPKPCFVGDAGPLYRQKHNPFIYYDNVRNDPARCQKIVPFTQFASDLKANALPNYVWITPDTCNDTHNCPISTGDAWLQKWVPQILASPAWKDKGVLFITYDEGDGLTSCCTYANGGQIDTLVISPLVQPGFTSNVPYDHYSILRTVEEAWKLPLLGKTNCSCSAPMTDFFVKPAGQE